jgi:hypothetical protein
MVIDSVKARYDSLKRYVKLIEMVVAGEITLNQFEHDYFELFKADETIKEDLEFDILNDLFMDLDNYTSDPALRDSGDFDDIQMMNRIPTALEKLKSRLLELETSLNI